MDARIIGVFMKKIFKIFCSLVLFIGIFASCNFAQQSFASNSALSKIKPNLDSKWELAYFDMIQNQWIAEYGLKGEDVVNFRWTKLITINFLGNFKASLTTKLYSENFKALLQQQAKSMGKTLSFKVIPANNGEYWFEWSIAGRNESEICRIIRRNTEMYHLHYAHKKPAFTQAERNSAISILKNIQIN